MSKAKHDPKPYKFRKLPVKDRYEVDHGGLIMGQVYKENGRWKWRSPPLTGMAVGEAESRDKAANILLRRYYRPEENPTTMTAKNPRAKKATTTTAANAGVAVDYFEGKHAIPVGKFGPWGLKTEEGSYDSVYVYGEGRVPVQVIHELDRRGFVFADEDADTQLGDEALLTIQNESSLYPQYQAIANNMAKIMSRGKYDATKAVVGWRHWIDNGFKQYSKEYDIKIDVPTRDYAARRAAREWEREHAIAGEFAAEDAAKARSSRNPGRSTSRALNPHNY